MDKFLEKLPRIGTPCPMQQCDGVISKVRGREGLFCWKCGTRFLQKYGKSILDE